VSFTKIDARKATLYIHAQIEFFPYFLHIPSDLNKICYGRYQKNVLSKYEFHENLCSESHTLPRGVYKFLPTISHSLSTWDTSQYKRSAHNVVEDL
jgi:hypothetical protein